MTPDPPYKQDVLQPVPGPVLHPQSEQRQRRLLQRAGGEEVLQVGGCHMAFQISIGVDIVLTVVTLVFQEGGGRGPGRGPGHPDGRRGRGRQQSQEEGPQAN